MTNPGTMSKPPAERLHEKKRRKCLKCGDNFLSQWAGNRLCKPCRDSAGRTSPVDDLPCNIRKR